MSWLLGALALGAIGATWALASNRRELFMTPAKAQLTIEGARRRREQTRLAEAIVGHLQADQ